MFWKRTEWNDYQYTIKGECVMKYCYEEGEEIRIDHEYVMKPRSIVVFTGRQVLR